MQRFLFIFYKNIDVLHYVDEEGDGDDDEENHDDGPQESTEESPAARSDDSYEDGSTDEHENPDSRSEGILSPINQSL